MKPHKYFRQKRAKDQRLNQYNTVYKPNAHYELSEKEIGRMKKHNFGDCGNAKCGICHNEKNYLPKERNTKKSIKFLNKEIEGQIEADIQAKEELLLRYEAHTDETWENQK